MSCFIILFVLIAGCHNGRQSHETDPAEPSGHQSEVTHSRVRRADDETGHQSEVTHSRVRRGAHNRTFKNEYIFIEVGNQNKMIFEFNTDERAIICIMLSQSNAIVKHNVQFVFGFYYHNEISIYNDLAQEDQPGKAAVFYHEFEKQYLFTPKQWYSYWVRWDTEGYVALGKAGTDSVVADWTVPWPFKVNYIGYKANQITWWRFRGTNEVLFSAFAKQVLEAVIKQKPQDLRVLFMHLQEQVDALLEGASMSRLGTQLVANIRHAIERLVLYDPVYIKQQTQRKLDHINDKLDSDVKHIVDLIDGEYTYRERRIMFRRLKILKEYPGNKMMPKLVVSGLLDVTMLPYFRQPERSDRTAVIVRLINDAIMTRVRALRTQDD